jgi:transcriptional regulator with XRE-family HTH domain
MTHFQDIFIRNIRYYRSKAGFSQVQFSLQLGVSPNYLNAVENGKNFPSTGVIQKMLDILQLLPYQLFLEQPVFADKNSGIDGGEKTELIHHDLTHIKQQFNHEIDRVIARYCVPN